MTDQRFIHLQLNGATWEVHEVKDGDTALNHVDNAEFVAPYTLIARQGTAALSAVPLGIREVLGRGGNGDMRGLDADEMRALLNVANGATAAPTGAELLVILAAVDGPGSGLDADTLDGIQGIGYSRATHTHPGIYVPVAQGVPSGGTAGQALVKSTDSDYDLEWSSSALFSLVSDPSPDLGGDLNLGGNRIVDGTAELLRLQGTNVYVGGNLVIPSDITTPAIGHILAYSEANSQFENIAPGTDGQVLTAVSGNPLGVGWTAAAGVTTILALNDVDESSYAGEAGALLGVNSTPDGVRFFTLSNVGGAGEVFAGVDAGTGAVTFRSLNASSSMLTITQTGTNLNLDVDPGAIDLQDLANVPALSDGVLTSLSGVLSWAAGGGGGAVDSVFGRTGVVVPVSGDYNASQVTVSPTAFGAAEVQAALTQAEVEIDLNTAAHVANLLVAHDQNSDTILDEGNANEVTAAELRLLADAIPGDRTYYISQEHGSDSNSGVQMDKPLASIARANTLAQLLSPLPSPTRYVRFVGLDDQHDEADVICRTGTFLDFQNSNFSNSGGTGEAMIRLEGDCTVWLGNAGSRTNAPMFSRINDVTEAEVPAYNAGTTYTTGEDVLYTPGALAYPFQYECQVASSLGQTPSTSTDWQRKATHVRPTRILCSKLNPGIWLYDDDQGTDVNGDANVPNPNQETILTAHSLTIGSTGFAVEDLKTILHLDIDKIYMVDPAGLGIPTVASVEPTGKLSGRMGPRFAETGGSPDLNNKGATAFINNGGVISVELNGNTEMHPDFFSHPEFTLNNWSNGSPYVAENLLTDVEHSFVARSINSRRRYFYCILGHTSDTADNAPGTGTNQATYWVECTYTALDHNSGKTYLTGPGCHGDVYVDGGGVVRLEDYGIRWFHLAQGNRLSTFINGTPFPDHSYSGAGEFGPTGDWDRQGADSTNSISNLCTNLAIAALLDHNGGLGDLLANIVLDGDKMDIDWTPSNYTPDASPAEAADVNDLSAHLKGIDDELAKIPGPAFIVSASVPTARTDGSALANGDVWPNPDDSRLYTYDSTADEWVSAPDRLDFFVNNNQVADGYLMFGASVARTANNGPVFNDVKLRCDRVLVSGLAFDTGTIQVHQDGTLITNGTSTTTSGANNSAQELTFASVPYFDATAGPNRLQLWWDLTSGANFQHINCALEYRHVIDGA